MLGVLACSALYFGASLAVAMVAEGFDLDQLPSRSRLAQAAEPISRLLWAPYHAIGRAIGPAPLQMRWFTPALLLANSLAWGLALYAAWRGLRAWRAQR